MKRTLVLVLLLTTPASARGWKSGNSEGACDVAHARSLYRMECGELYAAVEWQRLVVNQRIYSNNSRSQRTVVSPEPLPVPATTAHPGP